MNDLGLDFWQEQKTFLLCKNIQTSSGPPSSLIFSGYWVFPFLLCKNIQTSSGPPSSRIFSGYWVFSPFVKVAGVWSWPLTST